MNLLKRQKDKELRWKQPFSNAKMEDVIDIAQTFYLENQLLRELLVKKGLLEVDDFSKMIVETFNKNQNVTIDTDEAKN